MATMKVDSAKWELVKDAKEYNAFAWTGLTLGKLYALWTALHDQDRYRGQVGDSISPVANDCLIMLTQAITKAEAADGQQPFFSR